MTDRKANIQAGFSAGWSAKPEKTVPIAKSILEIRQALNVSPLSTISATNVQDQRGEDEARGKKRQGEIMWSKSKHRRELTKRINAITSGSCLKLPQYLLNLKNRRICWRKVSLLLGLLGVPYQEVSPFVADRLHPFLSSILFSFLPPRSTEKYHVGMERRERVE
jgi:hypothetical protein